MGSPAQIVCNKCRHSNPSGSIVCTHCQTALFSEAPTMENITITSGDVATDWSRVGSSEDLSTPLALSPGNVIADRYEILKLLGEGGMGAVYKARDRELDRLIALKVIRPELAGHPRVLQRFKQELLLARQVTHKNVIRIFDLGVWENLKFITMEFVEGRDLSALLEERKCTVPEAIDIIRQTCRALEAAHGESVIHRDLKPQNIMIGEGGKVSVMDFGLARTLESSGLTQAGAMIGTPAYMSPEQALGNPVDIRSDLFSLGIIFYEMVTGIVPFKADTLLATMLKRTQTTPAPPAELDPEIPKDVSDVILKTLATNPASRYQNAGEMLGDMDILAAHYGATGTSLAAGGAPGGGGGGRSNSVLSTYTSQVLAPPPPPAPPPAPPPLRQVSDSVAWKWITLCVAGAVLVLGGVYAAFFMKKGPAAPVAPMTVMIADFSNHTGDPVFSGTLESTLKLALEGASFISAYDRTRVRDLGLKVISGTLDEAKAQEIAAGQGLSVVVSGTLDRRGAEYRLSVRAVQTVTGKVLATAEETAPNKDQVLFAVTKLGTAVRKALGDSTPESAQRFSMDTLTAASLEAVHEYAAAVDLLSQGKLEESLKHFSQAVDLDADFGLAYAGMAVASHNLGRGQDAEKYIKQAITKIDHMTERERYRTRGFLYLQIGDEQKCVDEYSALLNRYPADTGALNNIALCSSHLRKMPMAVEHMRRVLAIWPKRALYHVNLSVYSAYAGDFPTAAKEAAVALQLNPSYGLGFQAQALASLAQEQVSGAAEAYHNLEKIRASDAATGLADVAVYEGRYREAVDILQKGAAADTATGRRDDAADKFAALAYAQLLREQKGPALEAVNRALSFSQSPKTRFVAGRVFVALGEAVKAKEIADGLAKELQIEPQAYGELLAGEAALKNGDGRGAVQSFTKANGLLDTWIGRFDLGRAYLELGAFVEADSEFDRCLKRRGEALALFSDVVPTYGYFPPVYYYQGRARQGMKSAGFAESYKKYLSIRGKAGEDPLLAEARRRTGG
jgi:tetratricopeptide (TPR) repeat protein